MLRNKGFTLLELLVALAIFIIVSIIAASIFIVAVKNQRQAFLVQNIQDNARFIIERFSKEARMGAFQVRDDDNRDFSLYFENQAGDNVRYRFETIEGINYLTRLEKQSGTIGIGEQGDFLNSSEVAATGRFSTINEAGKQPRVTISILLTPRGLSEPQVRVQNTVTSRRY